MKINLDIDNNNLQLLNEIATKNNVSVDEFVSDIVKNNIKNYTDMNSDRLFKIFNEGIEETDDEETEDILKTLKTLTKEDLEVVKEEIEKIILN